MTQQIDRCPNLAGIRVEGSTIYEMNARGDRRLWSATVCPGTHANGVRMASIQTVSIAERIARAVREAQEQRERAEKAEAEQDEAIDKYRRTNTELEQRERDLDQCRRYLRTAQQMASKFAADRDDALAKRDAMRDRFADLVNRFCRMTACSYPGFKDRSLRPPDCWCEDCPRRGLIDLSGAP